MAYTLRQLISQTSMRDIQKAQKSRIQGIKTNPNNALTRLAFIVKSKETYSNPKGHIVSLLYPTVNFRNPLSFFRKDPMSIEVRARCSCPAWIFWGSAFNSTEGNYLIQPFSEHRAPDIRDPKRVHLVCKHVVRVGKALQGKSFSQLKKIFKEDGKGLASDTEETLPVLLGILRGHKNVTNTQLIEISDKVKRGEIQVEDVMEQYDILVT